MIVIIRPGPLATIQDLGRPGLAGLGVGESGAADRRSLRLANRIAGNPESLAGIEVTLGGLVARFEAAATIAITGAACPLRLSGREVEMNAPIAVTDGEELRMGSPRRGLRSYLAVRGGVSAAPVLGSRATDTLSGIGPPVLTAGMRLPTGGGERNGAGDVESADLSPAAPEELPGDAEPVLAVIPGPRDHWFVDGAVATLIAAPYEVRPQSDRIGLRLAGARLRRRDDRELPPEPLVRGALQVPPSGQPMLFLADHPVTGGYPVIAVVADEDIDLAAQVRPGHLLRFRLHQRR